MTSGEHSQGVRVETDSFGPIEVPAERYWGAQTQRSLQNFRIGVERMPPPLIHALGLVKQAAARANTKLGLLAADVAAAIDAAGGDTKVAIVSLLARVDAETARSRLSAARGVIREAVGDVVG